MFFSAGCGTMKNLLSANDAEEAIREMLSIGTEFGGSVLGRKVHFQKLL
jgi:hypothetical protein